jgi:hypothetical protein
VPYYFGEAEIATEEVAIGLRIETEILLGSIFLSDFEEVRC